MFGLPILDGRAQSVVGYEGPAGSIQLGRSHGAAVMLAEPLRNGRLLIAVPISRQDVWLIHHILQATKILLAAITSHKEVPCSCCLQSASCAHMKCVI